MCVHFPLYYTIQCLLLYIFCNVFIGHNAVNVLFEIYLIVTNVCVSVYVFLVWKKWHQCCPVWYNSLVGIKGVQEAVLERDHLLEDWEETDTTGGAVVVYLGCSMTVLCLICACVLHCCVMQPSVIVNERKSCCSVLFHSALLLLQLAACMPPALHYILLFCVCEEVVLMLPQPSSGWVMGM